ncbi:MAG TPA: IS110 family transposase [Candidatus Angelobacter sp.]
MKKSIKKPNAKENKPERTVGMDLGDRWCHYCLLNRDGEVMETGEIKTKEKNLREHFEGEKRMRVAMECGTHSPWISRLLEELGHEVIVANARKIEAITGSESKDDDHDAEQLAVFAHFDPRLLYPIQHRSAERQRDLSLLQARRTLVQARTMIINSARGLVKSIGGRLPRCSSESFEQKTKSAVPANLAGLVTPLLEQVTLLNQQIKGMDQQIEELEKRYPEIIRLRSAPGVGPLVAAAYVLTLNGVQAVTHSRQVGAFLGLRPKRKQSGDSDPQCRITKTGNNYLRALLVQSAQYILGRFGPDSALRRWGLKLAASGGKRGKKRAIVAVARKLAVILHRMWSSGQNYQAFPQSSATTITVG